MRFTVLPPSKSPPSRPGAYLLTDLWNDWFKYSTQYMLYIVDDKKEQHRIGEVKIGQFDWEVDQKRPRLPDTFDALSAEFFSLGQDDSYYENLNKCGEEARINVLASLNDIAANQELYTRAIPETVTQESLFRSVTKVTAKGQFRRMAKGGARLTPYKFSYQFATEKGNRSRPGE